MKKILKRVFGMSVIFAGLCSSLCYADLIDPATGKRGGVILPPDVQDSTFQDNLPIIITAGIVVAIVVAVAIIVLVKSKKNKNNTTVKENTDTENNKN